MDLFTRTAAMNAERSWKHLIRLRLESNIMASINESYLFYFSTITSVFRFLTDLIMQILKKL